MIKQKKKNQKPIDIDAHFKYKCPIISCGYDYWISLKQAQTKNFKIVCDCGEVFSPKPIESLKIVYKKSNKKKYLKAPVDTEQQCVKILTGYGFSIDESLEITKKGFTKYKETNPVSLVRLIVKNLEEFNVS
jgi:hypothetical protein